jgi:hypothetical protein
MRRRLTRAILLLYPRPVRKGHGAEILALIDDLIAREGRSHARVFVRLTIDGLVQRIASTATVWTVLAVLTATGFSGLAVSNFAAARVFHGTPDTVHTVARSSQADQTPQPPRRSHPTSRTETIAVTATSAAASARVARRSAAAPGSKRRARRTRARRTRAGVPPRGSRTPADRR